MKIPNRIKPLSSEELTYFSSQLSLILKSGVNLSDGLMMLLDDTESEKAKNLITKISEVVNNENPLFVALESTGVFSSYYISMVKIGELTGHLDNVLDGLAIYYERDFNMKNALKGAIMHPIILLLMMSAVIGVLVLKVIPIFKQVFVQLGSTMSSSSVAAINFSTTTGVVLLITICALILIGLLLYILSRFPKLNQFFSKVLSNVIFFKGINEKISMLYFTSAMSFMLTSGVEASEALDLSREVTSNKKLSEKIMACQEKVHMHTPFAKAITEVGIFPSLYAQMIKISYKTGALDSVWGEISKRYDDDVTDSLNNMVSFIEPLLVGILSIIIGSILISVMLPLISVMSSLG